MTSVSLVVDQSARPGVEARQTAARAVRLDIQALRAVAILLVLLHHAGVPFVPGGFLGVDIFFVVSGFLMTGMIDEGLENRSFTFVEFYKRRIRRLLPAAYCTLIGTAIAAPLLLDSLEMHEFVLQLVGSFSFSSNMVLWRQTSYFGSGAELKPLLHMWSLSLEEQFYIVLPVALLLCRHRLRLPLLVVLTIGSALLCAIALQRNPALAFYMLPTRAWELALGGCVALAVRRNLIHPAPMAIMRLLAVAVLVALPLLFDESGHPGLPAVAACIATAALLVPGERWLQRRGALVPVLAIGDRSYSLYLVHWPLIAFANNLYLHALPAWVSALMVLLCFVSAELQFRLVENRFRRFAFARTSIALLVLIPVVSVGGTWAAAKLAMQPGTLERTGTQGLSPECNFRDRFEPRPACRSASAPRIMVWGDSFAMHLVDGITATSQGGVVQATRTFCGPFRNIAVIDRRLYGSGWAESCIAFNESVLEQLRRTPSVEIVVLSSPLVQYLPGAEPGERTLLVRSGNKSSEQNRSAAHLLEGLRATVDAVHEMGKRVVLVSPPPSLEFGIARCLDRRNSGRPTLGADADCRIPAANFETYRKPSLDFLAVAEARGLAPQLRLDRYLCETGECRTQIGTVEIYGETGHLSASGSRALAREMQWGRLIEQLAR